ncbi:hypothetical protein [Azohydromonas australica]|uniref:hypothetical protein n=1 Tax=Azohydromonas australica TaxID=364039 RepID=UPI0012EB5B2E|nr:hypothetical protein [Azohydromonas australica]
MSDEIEFVKSEILDYFRERNADVGHALHAPAFNFQRIMRWNPKQKAALDEAVAELIADGLVESDGSTVVLTKRGVDLIY